MRASKITLTTQECDRRKYKTWGTCSTTYGAHLRFYKQELETSQYIKDLSNQWVLNLTAQL